MSRNFWIGLVASFAVVVLAVGILALVTSLRGSNVELPDEVGGLAARDSAAFYENLDKEVDEKAEQNIAKAGTADDYNSERFSEAFDGADVDTRVYFDDSAERSVSVLAIGDDAGPLVPDSFDDPEYLKIELPRVERVTEGDAECLLFRGQVVAAGEEYTEEQAAPAAITCQRTSGRLTVRVRALGGPDLDETVDFLGDVWDELE